MNDAAPAADLMPLMVGIQDSMLARVSVRGAGGGIGFSFPGSSRIATHLSPPLKRRLLRVFFGPQVPLHMPAAAQGRPMVNAIGDADLVVTGLDMLAQYIERTGVACFNHPSAVLGTRRDRVAAKLAGIAGLQVPRTLRLRIDEPADLLRAADDNGLRWPLIVRMAGTHDGATSARVDEPGQLKQALRGMPWGGHDLYLTEYVDCRDDDGHYRKLRLVVVGRDIFLRHLIISNGWLVHAHDREAGQLEEELTLLSNFPGTLLPKIRDAVLAVADALDMDYFGMDCNLRPDGRLLVFEANVMMDILANTSASPNGWDEPIRRIHDALAALLFEPTRWRHGARRMEPVA